jgi:Membrane protein involved in the export of O-antigen and teichoic acid
MRRFFVKNLLFILTVNLLVKPIWIFVIDRTVQNRVGHASYGLYSALFNMGIIFQILLDFGLSNYNTRLISQNPEKLKEIFPSMFSARLVLVLVYTILVGIFAWAIGYRAEELPLLAGVLLIQVLTATILFLRSNVAALHKFKVDSILSVSDRLFMIALCGFLLYSPATKDDFTIEWFVLAQIVSFGFAIAMALVVLRRIAGVKATLSLNLPEVSKIIKQSAPYALLIFLMSVYTRSDMLLLERLAGANGQEQAGIYAAAYRMLDVCNIFGLMFAGILLPLFGRMLAQKQHIAPIISLSVNLMLPLSFILAVAAAYYGTDIMHLLYKNNTPDDGLIFALLIASFPAFCIMYIYSTLLTASGNLKLLNIIALGGVIINLTLNMLFIPDYKALGAATTALVTQTSLAICFIVFAKKNMQLNRNLKWVARHILFVTLLVAIGYGVKQLSIDWVLQLAVYGVIAFITVFLFRFVSIDSVKKLLEKS